jgi:hypothetical protein
MNFIIVHALNCIEMSHNLLWVCALCSESHVKHPQVGGVHSAVVYLLVRITTN